MIQDRIDALLRLSVKIDDPELAALAYRLSTEVARLETGVYDDYRAVESCLKNIVGRMEMSNEEKSDLYFKILLISKNGVSQIQLVLDLMAKDARPLPAVIAPVEVRSNGRRVSALEYVVIAIIALAGIAVAVLALNKFGVIRLPFTLPISWLNPSFADILFSMGIF